MSPVSHDSQMGVVRNVRALRTRIAAWRAKGLAVGFVPTMGALHEGHISLVKTACNLADRAVASIFVNPRQFAAHEDLATYPRNEAADLERLQAAGCHLAYLPSPEEMYPPGFETSVTPGPLGRALEGEARPHFFGGVATVVCKLFNQVRPDIAVFGEKDYQQLLVVRQMVRDLDMPVEIVGAPIVREPDGLAMSSRNAYLSVDERKIAGRLNGALRAAAERLAQGAPVAEAMEEARAALREAGFDGIDYVETRAAADLSPLEPGPLAPGARARVLAAVRIGRTRLIDNWPAERKS
ncbi:pantothenate synthetase [Amphiplicatus metriothermophilus]|uniref:Pantothenate synthetase n=2 Tax=Amphiplicatus metriothermophilus TaxID=1519374 RepID=A0A239PQ11_9PROT|nr:pantothenate synthetase [Amphiplicatus metriothermophilus]